MALGGYKFKGYHVTRPSSYVAGTVADEVAWVLLMHKAQIKSFIEASNLANAGWAFDPDLVSGGYAFETFGNVIYCLDSLGYNYVSFFKHDTGDGYFAICTFTNHDFRTADLANGVIRLVPPNNIGQYTSYYYSGICTLYCKISKIQLTPDNIRSYGNNLMLLVPRGANNTGDSIYPSIGPSNWSSNYPYCQFSDFFTGFAVKDKNIVSFVSRSLSKGINSCIYSIDGFSSLCNSNDTNNIFSINFQSNTSNTSSGEVYENYATGTSSTSTVTLTNNSDGQFTFAGIFYNSFSAYSGDMQCYPFNSIAISNVYNSELHNYGKGYVAIDLIAVSLPLNTSQRPVKTTTVANGNYLMVGYANQTNASNLSFTIQGGYFCCGWDPSNPDIRETTSWTEYNE